MKFLYFIESVALWLILIGVGLGGWVLVGWAIFQLAHHYRG